MAETKTTASTLSKLKFSGYVQGRYESREDSFSGVDGLNRPTNFDRFLVRRAPLKTTYIGENAEYMLQIDAIGDGVVTLSDAEATFVDTWTPLGIRTTPGSSRSRSATRCCNRPATARCPNARASSTRCSRASAIAACASPPARTGCASPARRSTARSQATPPMAPDQNQYPDVDGRLGVDLDFLIVDVSGQYGEKLATSASANTGAGTDLDGD